MASPGNQHFEPANCIGSLLPPHKIFGYVYGVLCNIVL